MAIPSDAQIRDVSIHPENYALGVREDGQPIIRERGRAGALIRGTLSPEAQRAGEIVLKNLSVSPNDPYLKACAQLIVSKEHEGEISAELKNRLQTILTPPSASKPSVHIPRAAAESEPERKTKAEAARPRSSVAEPAAPPPPPSKGFFEKISSGFRNLVKGSQSDSGTREGKVGAIQHKNQGIRREGPPPAGSPPPGPAGVPPSASRTPAPTIPGPAKKEGRRGAAAGPTDEPVLGSAAAKGKEFDIGGLAEAAIGPPMLFDVAKLSENGTASPLEQELLKGCLDVRAAVVLPFELNAIKSNPHYPDLQNYNLELMRVKAMANYIEDKREAIHQKGGPDKKAALDVLEKYRLMLNGAYKEIQSERIAFVKANFPENPVYALAIPVKLNAGAHYFTAGADADMRTMLYKGFTFDAAAPATCCHSTESWEKVEKSFLGSEGDGFVGYEMGDKGYYFSLGAAPYQNPNWPYVLETELMEDINGVSIPQVVSDLAIKKGHNPEARKNRFTPVEIEKGYAALQKDFGFLQHQGLTKADDTEVVFIDPQHKLKPVGWQFHYMTESDMNLLPEQIGVEGTPPPIHASWRQ